MSSGPNYLSYLTPDTDFQKVITAVAVAGVMFAVGGATASRLKTAAGLDQELIPSKSPGLFGIVDVLIEAFINYYDSILGAHNRKHLPFVASIFFFILFSNLLGLIPGMPALTTTVWVNVAMALVVFVYFNAEGIREHGLVSYLKHFCGPLWVMAPLIFPLELFSITLRVLTLNLRLYWNITADHIVLDIFTDMLGPLLPLPFYVLGTFVCFMQAFIFTTLTLVYILLATQHEEEEHH